MSSEEYRAAAICPDARRDQDGLIGHWRPGRVSGAEVAWLLGDVGPVVRNGHLCVPAAIRATLATNDDPDCNACGACNPKLMSDFFLAHALWTPTESMT